MTPDKAHRRAIFATWCEERQAKLNSLHSLVAAEVKGVAMERIRLGGAPDITPSDLRACEGRVVSRLRIKQYGAMPTEATEWARQHNEIRATLGLMPISTTHPRAAA